MNGETNFRWYIIQAKSNAEKAAVKNLQARIERFGMEENFGRIVVPTEEVVTMRKGQKKITERKFFPGYVLLQIADEEGKNIMSNEVWHVVIKTDKVAGFLGGSKSKPVPISDMEADKILSRMEKAEGKPVLKIDFKKGQDVRILTGPFNDFDGVVNSVDSSRGIVRVDVLVFGRPTPVDFKLNEIEVLTS